MGAAVWFSKGEDPVLKQRCFSCDGHLDPYRDSHLTKWEAFPYAKQLRKLMFRIARHKLGVEP